MTATLGTAADPAPTSHRPAHTAASPGTPGPDRTAPHQAADQGRDSTENTPDTPASTHHVPPPPARAARRGALARRAQRGDDGRRTRTAPPGRPSRPRDTRRPPSPAGPGSRPRPRTATPPVSRPARLHDWFAAQLLLVLSGQRPVHTMLGHTRGEAYDQLVRLAPHAPLRPTGRHAPTPTVHRVGVFQPRPGAVEVFARVLSGSRLRAMAFRLEFARGRRWLCSAVEVDV